IPIAKRAISLVLSASPASTVTFQSEKTRQPIVKCPTVARKTRLSATIGSRSGFASVRPAAILGFSALSPLVCESAESGLSAIRFNRRYSSRCDTVIAASKRSSTPARPSCVCLTRFRAARRNPSHSSIPQSFFSQLLRLPQSFCVLRVSKWRAKTKSALHGSSHLPLPQGVSVNVEARLGPESRLSSMMNGTPSTDAKERARPHEPPTSFFQSSGPCTTRERPLLTEKNTVELQFAVPPMLLAAKRFVPGRPATTRLPCESSRAFNNSLDGVNGF